MDINTLRNKDLKVLCIGSYHVIIQSILDFDYLLGKEHPSVCVIIATGRRYERYFFGKKEILLPVYSVVEEVPQDTQAQVSLFLNLSSGRRVLQSTEDVITTLPHLLGGAIFAEDVPEKHAIELYHLSQSKHMFIAGPASVGIMIPAFLKLGAIGDVIRTTPILPGLKAKYKNCGIDWVTKKESFDVLKNNNLINYIYIIDNNTINKLKNKKYDLVICLDDDYESCELASSVNSKKIIGSYLNKNQKKYTKDSFLWFDMGLISKFGKQKADELKAKNKKTYQEITYKILSLNYKKQEPILILNRNELNFGKKFSRKNNIKKSDLVIGVNTGAGGRWEDKKLSIEKTAELIGKLNKQVKNAKLLLFGGPEERERNKKIKSLVKTRIIGAGCGNSLMEFASLINLCNILITSDSLALHIGIALKKKVVAFFYVTSATEIELYGRGIKLIAKGKDYCSYKAKCDYPPKWNIDEIVTAVKKFIQK